MTATDFFATIEALGFAPTDDTITVTETPVERITTVEVSEHKSDSWSTAPNGSAHCHDFYTTVISRQEWAAIPENGQYAGLAYKLTDLYISNSPDRRGQLVSSSSSPWKE